MIVEYDQKSEKLLVSVINKNLIDQLKTKSSFQVIEKTERYISGFISLEDLVFDF
ncbi:MAG: hypothetical protein ACOCRZ_02985 [Halothermotrichaceae bacterium]